MIAKLKVAFANYRITILTVILFIGMGFVNPYFLKERNLWGLFVAMPAYGIAALGLTFVLISGKLDISLGSVMALTSVVFALVVGHVGFYAAVLIAILGGAVLGAITGTMVAWLHMDAFVSSLSAMITYKGIALYISKMKPVIVSDTVVIVIGETNFGPIPVTFFIFLAFVLMAHLVLSRTSFGRNLYAIGGNTKIAESVGINISIHHFAVFMINGVLASIGGIIMMTRLFSASGNLAIDLPLTVIPMVIIGGTAFSGGRGGAFKTLSGVVLMYTVFNVMSMFNIYVNIQQFIKGFIMLTIVVVDKYMDNRNSKV